jgi:hypothetical protein
MFEDVLGWAGVFCLTFAAIAASRLALRIMVVALWLIEQRQAPAPQPAATGPDLRAEPAWAWRRAA